jgi:hypothetical protein
MFYSVFYVSHFHCLTLLTHNVLRYMPLDHVLFLCHCFSGLPLGLYTSHWQRTVNMRGGCLSAGASMGQRECQSSYAPDLDYDIQGLFDIDE